MTVSWAPAQTATVFGGTGFLGRRVVRRLREAGFAVRFAARHPERGRSLFADGKPGIASIRADINEESAVADAGSPSAYIRSRGEGEAAVLRAFAAATLIRPAVMF